MATKRVIAITGASSGIGRAAAGGEALAIAAAVTREADMEQLRLDVNDTGTYLAARAALRVCRRHPTPEFYRHFNSRFLVVLNAIATGSTDRIVQRFGRRPIR